MWRGRGKRSERMWVSESVYSRRMLSKSPCRLDLDWPLVSSTISFSKYLNALVVNLSVVAVQGVGWYRGYRG